MNVIKMIPTALLNGALSQREVFASHCDLWLGTATMAIIIASYFMRIHFAQKGQREKAMKRSMSCPAVVELNSPPALNACAELFASFDARQNKRRMMPRVPSMPTLAEVEREDGSFRSRRPSVEDEASFNKCSRQGSRRASREKQEGKDAPPSVLGLLIDDTSPANSISALDLGRSRRASSEGASLSVRPEPPHVIVLGERLAGKSAIISSLEGFAERQGVQLNAVKGLDTLTNSPQLAQVVPLVVWDAEQPTTLSECVTRHMGELLTVLQERPNSAFAKELHGKLVVMCNKTDAEPCPLPELSALDPKTTFLAGSSLRGTNMDALWRLIRSRTALPPRSDHAHL